MIKILFLGGNRYFGKKIVNCLSKNKNIQIYLINRGKKKNLNKKNIFHLKIDRSFIQETSFFLKNNYFDIVFDNIAYNLNDVKKLLKIPIDLLIYWRIFHFLIGSKTVFVVFLNLLKNKLKIITSRKNKC